MKLGIQLGTFNATIAIDMDLIREAESMGFDSVWTSEAYGSEAVSQASWVLAQTSRIKVGTAIMQVSARTPANVAMTAMTLDQLSDGRFILGLGPSGPQVIEGWHGMPYAGALPRLRECIEIVRKILARNEPVTFDGAHYQMPYKGPGATGLGKPLRSILHGNPNLPIYTAAVTPAGVRTAAEIAEGVFPVFMNPDRFDLYQAALEEGFAKAGGGKGLHNFDVAPFVNVIVGDDLDQCREPVRQMLGLYIGGMGAREKNFYNDYAKRLGYADAAVKIQDLFLSGKRGEAVAAVPDQLIDDVALVGPKERIADRLGAWKQAAAQGHVGTLIATGPRREAIHALADAVL